MQLLRTLAVLPFTLAALGGLGQGIHWDVDTLLGVVAVGLVLLTLSWLEPPAPPRP